MREFTGKNGKGVQKFIWQSSRCSGQEQTLSPDLYFINGTAKSRSELSETCPSPEHYLT